MNTYRTVTRSTVLLGLSLLVALFANTANAAHNESKEAMDESTKVVLEGYDAVSYFTEMKARKGNPHITTEWMGEIWQFASEKNRDIFLSNPAKYVPAYGGHCAISIRNGKAEVANPACFVVEAERLYLLANSKLVDRLRKDLTSNIKEANESWEVLKSNVR